MIGMISMIRACTGSAGCGLSFVLTNIEIAYTTGRMKKGSGAERSLIQPIHGAWRSSIDASSTQ